MTAPKHDTLVRRLVLILIKFNQGEKLDPVALADEFGVNLRTIQRDLNERFAYLPIERIDGLYHLNPAFLGKLNTRDIQHFAGLAGVRGLFPAISDNFLRDIFDTRIQSALLVKGHHYEDLGGKDRGFWQLERAIVAHQRISFDFQKDGGAKSYADVEPYKLVNHKGIWYLAASHPADATVARGQPIVGQVVGPPVDAEDPVDAVLEARADMPHSLDRCPGRSHAARHRADHAAWPAPRKR